MISLDMAKKYLRVDSGDEDSLIAAFLATAESAVRDVARMEPEEWDSAYLGYADGEEHWKQLTVHQAVLYALGYYYTHREDVDGKELMTTLRWMLNPTREGKLFG